MKLFPVDITNIKPTFKENHKKLMILSSKYWKYNKFKKFGPGNISWYRCKILLEKPVKNPF